LTWTKVGNPSFIKVTVVAGGGGGGGGASASPTVGGGGGGGGGATEAIFDAANISSATIFIGGGGTAGIGSRSGGPNIGTPGNSGGNSSFSAGAFSLSATGGGGGQRGGATPTNVPIGLPQYGGGGVSGQGNVLINSRNTQEGADAIIGSTPAAPATGGGAFPGGDGYYTSGGGAGGSVNPYTPSVNLNSGNASPSGYALVGNTYTLFNNVYGANGNIGATYTLPFIDKYYLNNSSISVPISTPFLGTGGSGGENTIYTGNQVGGDGGAGTYGGGGGGGGAAVVSPAPIGINYAGGGGAGGSGVVFIYSY
jgi:hypothetical protein